MFENDWAGRVMSPMNFGSRAPARSVTFLVTGLLSVLLLLINSVGASELATGR